MLPTQKVAVVLGASAKNGIGWACVERLVAEGAKVVVGARSYDRLKSMCAPIGAVAVKCDAASRDDIRNLAAVALKEYGHLDIAVNSAGNGVLSSIADVTEEMLREAMVVNYYGMVNFVQTMTAAMGTRAADNFGSVVLVSTLSVDHPMAPVFPYAAAKGATDTLVRYAALEYGPKHIKVNSINPGFVMTDMARSSDLQGLEIVEQMAGKASALGRIATAAECADAVYWLASSAFVTGTHVKVCGGNQLRSQFGD